MEVFDIVVMPGESVNMGIISSDHGEAEFSIMCASGAIAWLEPCLASATHPFFRVADCVSIHAALGFTQAIFARPFPLCSLLRAGAHNTHVHPILLTFLMALPAFHSAMPQVRGPAGH